MRSNAATNSAGVSARITPRDAESRNGFSTQGYEAPRATRSGSAAVVSSSNRRDGSGDHGRVVVHRHDAVQHLAARERPRLPCGSRRVGEIECHESDGVGPLEGAGPL